MLLFGVSRSILFLADAGLSRYGAKNNMDWDPQYWEKQYLPDINWVVCLKTASTSSSMVEARRFLPPRIIFPSKLELQEYIFCISFILRPPTPIQ